MQEMKGLFFKVLGIKHAFFQCMHTQGVADQVHPGQGPILGFLLHAGGGSQADIVRTLNVSAATVAVSVARLEKLELVTRERNQANRRANVLMLTERGREVALHMEQAMNEVACAALKGFDAGERKTLESYCDRMMENFKTHYGTRSEP